MHRFIEKRGVVVTALGLLLAAAALMGADESSCVPVEPDGCETHDDCGEGLYCDDGACETLGYCEQATDCEGQPLTTPACVGYFTCESNECAWHCGGPLTCAEWYERYTAVATELRACTSADQCEAVPGTSCGCTRNLVVNGTNDLAPLWDVLDGMNAAGCGVVSTCDCPPADGFVCEDGLCAWNYIGYE